MIPPMILRPSQRHWVYGRIVTEEQDRGLWNQAAERTAKGGGYFFSSVFFSVLFFSPFFSPFLSVFLSPFLSLFFSAFFVVSVFSVFLSFCCWPKVGTVIPTITVRANRSPNTLFIRFSLLISMLILFSPGAV